MEEQDSFTAALKKAREYAAKMQATMKPSGADDPSTKTTGSETTNVIDNKKKLALQIANNLSRRIPKDIRVVNQGVNRDGEMVIHMMIPSIIVCLFAGKDNETVEWMRRSTGCKMEMDFEHPYANPNEKPLTITGTPDRVEYAREVITNYIREKDELLGDTPNNMQLSLGIEYSELQIPKETIGLVIGKQGENIKKINMETGCTIKFRPLGPRDDERFRIATFQGTTIQIKKAREQMVELVEFIKQKYGLARPIPKAGQELEEVRVSAAKAGIVIGKGGENIKQINNLSGAMVCIDRSIPDHAQFRNFFVVGTRQQIDHAKFLIREKSGESGDLPIGALLSLNPLIGGPDSFADQPPMPASFLAMAASMMPQYQKAQSYQDPYQQYYPPPGADTSHVQPQAAVNPQDYSAYWASYYQQYYANYPQTSDPAASQAQPQDGTVQQDQASQQAYWQAYYQQYYAQNPELYQQYLDAYNQSVQAQTNQQPAENPTESQNGETRNGAEAVSCPSENKPTTNDISDSEVMQIDDNRNDEDDKVKAEYPVVTSPSKDNDTPKETNDKHHSPANHSQSIDDSAPSSPDPKKKAKSGRKPGRPRGIKKNKK